MRPILTLTALIFALVGQTIGQTAKQEAKFYQLIEIATPAGERLEIGGIDFLPTQEMVVSTRRGRVWLVTNPTTESPSFDLFAEGLQDCLGLSVKNGKIFVVSRGELSRLQDVDGDGHADIIDTVCDDWGVSGNYHEYAYGLPTDDHGNFFVSLNVAFTSPKWWLGSAPSPYRGWVVKISPTGTMTPFATGFRSPCGIGMNIEGDLFVTDNQGDWMPACPLYHVEAGKFYGHPAGLRWTEEYLARGEIPSQTDPPGRQRSMPAAWLPYKWARSAGQMIADTTGGGFGPFAGQMFVSELTNGNILRVQREKIRGQYQGAVFLFRHQVGSAVRLAFSPDKKLIIGRTNRGWGGLNPGDGLAILNWTKVVPFEIHSVQIKNDGFDIQFTKPIKQKTIVGTDAVRLIEYDYNYWWEYGSPEVHKKPLQVQTIVVAKDRRSIRVVIPKLRPGKVVEAVLSAFESNSGDQLLHPEFHYTVNQLPIGPVNVEHVAKTVPPPAAKESPYEGWLYLNKINGDDLWSGFGWKTVKHKEFDLALDPKDAARITEIATKSPDAKGADGQSSPISLLSEFGKSPADKTCLIPHPSIETWFDVFLPKGGSASVFFQSRYELKFSDDPQGKGLFFGAIADKKVPLDLYKGAGEWHVVHMEFRAAGFDESGKKFINAKFKNVTIDGTLLYESVELPQATAGAPLATESRSQAPLTLRINAGQAAFRRFSMKALGLPLDDNNWQHVFNGTDIAEWQRSDEATWKVEKGVIVGSGKQGHLFSPRSDYKNFDLKARVQINDNGNSGLYFRTTFGPGWPKGYEAQVNSTYHDPVKSGSLYGFRNIKAMFVEPGVWFDYFVSCRDEDQGIRIKIKLNNFLVVDYLDTKRTNSSGHIALQQHHEGSEVRFRDIMIREK